MTDSKRCPKCGLDLPKDKFPPSKQTKDGLHGWCRGCNVKSTRKYQDKLRETYASGGVQVPDVKKCGRCKSVFSSDCFYQNGKSKDGLNSWCKVCFAKYNQFQSKKYADKLRLRETVDIPEMCQCSLCKRVLPSSQFTRDITALRGVHAWCKDCGKDKRRRYRLDALRYYSNEEMRCACCGEQHEEFLSIDHINGGGRQHRKEYHNANLYTHLKKEGYPEGYRVLCHNCNQSLGLYGYCPHEKERQKQSRTQ